MFGHRLGALQGGGGGGVLPSFQCIPVWGGVYMVMFRFKDLRYS